MNTTNTNCMNNTTPPAASEGSLQAIRDTIREAVLEAARAASPKPKPKAAPKAGPKVTIGVTAPILPNLFYDHNIDRYWMKMPNGHWIKLNNRFISPHLCDTAQYQSLSDEDKKCFTTDVLLSTQRYAAVNFAGDLAGYSEGLVVQGTTRILVTSSPKFITPKAGDWDMLRGVMKRMFGDVQIPYVYGWIKLALEMFDARVWMAGQVLVLCGPVQSGKNLFGFLLEKLFGGRAPGKPYDYMTGATPFNSDFMGCELLTIEDEVSHIGIQARKDFGSKIKDLAANAPRRLHRKHAEALTVMPLQRLLISLNDEPERLLILPPIDPDIEDKIMLLKVDKHPMPMPTHTAAAKAAFSTALVAQLPAFVDFLHKWKIPTELVADRFGIAHYHHPDILEGLHEQSPEEQLLALIDEVIFPPGLMKPDWHGKAVELDRALKNAESKNVQREAEKLLPAANSCGKYLGRLAKRHPDRIIKYPGSAGTHRWTIMAPQPGGFGTTPGPSPGSAVHSMLKKLRELSAQAPKSDEARSLNSGDSDLGEPQSHFPAMSSHELANVVKSVKTKGESTQESPSEEGDTQSSAA